MSPHGGFLPRYNLPSNSIRVDRTRGLIHATASLAGQSRASFRARTRLYTLEHLAIQCTGQTRTPSRSFSESRKF